MGGQEIYFKERGGGREEGGRKGGKSGGGRGGGRILPRRVRAPNTMAAVTPTTRASVLKRNSNCFWLNLE